MMTATMVRRVSSHAVASPRPGQRCVRDIIRRIFCLLENQLPLVLDAIGTGYVVAKGDVQEQRPAPLRHAHVQAFRNRYEGSLYFTSCST